MAKQKDFPPIEVPIHLEGTTALVYHNPTVLADKQHPITRAIQDLVDKGSKITEADQEEIDRLRFVASLYYDPEVGLYLPTWNLIAAMTRAAATWKLGTTVTRAVSTTGPWFPILYDGPRNPVELWGKSEFRFRTSVGINRGRIMTVRPIIRQWQADLTLILVQDLMDLSNFGRITDLAGQVQGLGDARKLGYGRFSVTLGRAKELAA